MISPTCGKLFTRGSSVQPVFRASVNGAVACQQSTRSDMMNRYMSCNASCLSFGARALTTKLKP